jgi:hypothetical protein
MYCRALNPNEAICYGHHLGGLGVSAASGLSTRDLIAGAPGKDEEIQCGKGEVHTGVAVTRDPLMIFFLCMFLFAFGDGFGNSVS